VCKPQCKLELKRPPSLSSFRPQLITCRKGSNTSECLTVDQLESLRKLYSNYLEGELGYPTGLATAEPYQISTDYYKYFVLNDTTWDYHTLNASVIKLGMDINPGQMDVSGLFTVC
jgi:feruloyl esterase